MIRVSDRLLHTLEKYLPEDAASYAHSLLWQYGIQLHIKKPRKTKLGDYRPPQKGEPHRISINNNLNQYAFLVTFLHETAHLINFEKNGFKVQPHGLEWKREFQSISAPILNPDLFPVELYSALQKYLNNPKASSCTSPELVRALRKYDEADGDSVLLEMLPLNAEFYIDERLFVRGNKMRSRYRCMEQSSGKWYFVPGLMEVVPKV